MENVETLLEELQKSVKQAQSTLQKNSAGKTDDSPLVKAKAAQPVQEPLQKANPAPSASSQSSGTIGSNGIFQLRRLDTSKYNGYQLAALKVGLDPETPGLEKMTIDDMKQLAYKKQLDEVVNPQRRRLGMPDLVPERTRNHVIPSY